MNGLLFVFLQYLFLLNYYNTGVYAHLILQVPDSILVSELLIAGATLGEDAALKATHVKEQVGVVFAVNRHKAVLPLHSGHRSGQAILDVPKHCSPAGQIKTRLFSNFMTTS